MNDTAILLLMKLNCGRHSGLWLKSWFASFSRYKAEATLRTVALGAVNRHKMIVSEVIFK